jgi:hypothetical protein
MPGSPDWIASGVTPDSQTRPRSVGRRDAAVVVGVEDAQGLQAVVADKKLGRSSRMVPREPGQLPVACLVGLYNVDGRATVAAMRRTQALLGIACLACAACRGATASGPCAVASVAATTTVAAAVGAVNLANHVCFTVCPAGTACNPKTGFCDRGGLHDDSACGAHGCPNGKSCDNRGLLPQCVDQAANDEDLDTTRTYRAANTFQLTPLATPTFP